MERRNFTMTEPNNQSLSDNQNERIIDSLKYEIASLKFQLTKKDGRISTLDAMLNQVMESHNAEVRAYENLKDELDDVIGMLRKRVSHGDILDFLKVKDSNQFQFKKLW
jgi:predicted RNase H-like nuclease (RuvC/YqgF family)